MVFESWCVCVHNTYRFRQSMKLSFSLCGVKPSCNDDASCLEPCCVVGRFILVTPLLEYDWLHLVVAFIRWFC